MHITIDLHVVQHVQDFPEFVSTHRADSTVQVFNPYLSATEIISHLTSTRPDVLIVDPRWLIIAALLRRLIEASGLTATPLVLGVKETNNVFKVQAAHHGFFDIVELDVEPEKLFDRIERIRGGVSSLASDVLWAKVQPPLVLPDVSKLPEDATDNAILELLRIGLHDADIAAVIGMSIQTVRNRISGMLHRSGLSNRTQMAWAQVNQVLVSTMLGSVEVDQQKK